jgi:hypothetical protein
MRWRGAVGCALLVMLAAAPAFGAQALAGLANWHADSCGAASGNRPLVLFFTLPGCRFCNDVRQRYMLPLARDGMLVREVVIDSDRPVTGFPGAATQRAVASKMGVKIAPAVLLVDASGHPLADPIVGGDVAGLYGGSLDNALALAARRLAMDAEGHGGDNSAASHGCQH